MVSGVQVAAGIFEIQREIPGSSLGPQWVNKVLLPYPQPACFDIGVSCRVEGQAEEVGDPLHTRDPLCAVSPLTCLPLFLPLLWVSIVDLFSETFSETTLS